MKKKIIYGCEARGDANSPYLTRYTLINRPNWQLCVHVFHRSDADDLHDHPWDFWSLILWRGYLEQTAAGKKRVWPGMLLRRKAEHAHRVELLRKWVPVMTKTEWMPGEFVRGLRFAGLLPAVTLVLMFKRRREWGFFEKGMWTRWVEYFTAKGC